MQQRRKAVVGGITALVVAAGIGSAAVAAGRISDPPAERQREAAYTDAHRRDVATSQDAAERIALGTRRGSVVESHLESEGQGLRWEVKVDDGTTVWEIQIDPTTGAVRSAGQGEPS